MLKFGSAYFIDLRYQQIVSPPAYSAAAILTAVGLTLLAAALQQELLRRAGAGNREWLRASFPLAALAPMWLLTPNFPLLILTIALVSWSAGRTAAQCTALPLPRLAPRRAFALLAALWILWAAVGGWQQWHSLTSLGMEWMDWGHFYEMLNNFFKGKPFHLNLAGGNFLGSRFAPSMVLLLPVVAFRSVAFFLFTGSLLVGSGALFVYGIARATGASPTESLFWGVWYLLIPGFVNMNMPLLDGFHEVFLLIPLVLAAVLCALRHRRIAAAILVILACGVRETAGFILAGWGAVLFLRGRRREGAALCLGAIAYIVLVIAVLMPLFNPPVAGTYAHAGFYSHLGNDIPEIALSPIRRPGAFWGALFNLHNLGFWCTLFLPFLLVAGNAPIWLLPLIPDFVMVSVDRRFDTQTVLRHYQAAMLLVLVVAALAGAKRLREGRVMPWLRLVFAGIPHPDLRRGAAGAAFAAALVSTLLLTQFPGLPASDPQRRSDAPEGLRWSDARPMMARFTELIPPGAGVTAGPRLASLLVNRNELYFDFRPNDRNLQDYVLIENFFKIYHEDVLSRYLLCSPKWRLARQEFLDERSIQLFIRTRTPETIPPPVKPIGDAEWQRLGTPVPTNRENAFDDVEVRGAPLAPGKLWIGARIRRTPASDRGFRVTLEFADGSRRHHFTSFGNGRRPADLAKVGDAFGFIVEYPAERQLVNCRVDIVLL